MLIAVLISLCCRSIDLNEDDDLEDDEYDPTVVDDSDEWPASGDFLNTPTNFFFSRFL